MSRCPVCHKENHDFKELCPEWEAPKPLEPVFKKVPDGDLSRYGLLPKVEIKWELGK